MSYYKYGKKSKLILSGADLSLQEIFNFAIKLGLIDISILESHRDKATQNKLFKQGKSKVKWPDGKHNKKPSMAVDACPFVNGKASFDYNHCIFLAGIICTIGKFFGYSVRWGGNWDNDGEPISDQDFQDLIHYEIKV